MVWDGVNRLKAEEDWETVTSKKENNLKRASKLSATEEGDGYASEYSDSNSFKKSNRLPEKLQQADTVVEMNLLSEEDSLEALPILLNEYILSKCDSSEHCKKSDFDGTAREALSRISFLQALQAIEHFAGSVSSRIQKRPAYLMGILRGQEQHWDKSRAAASLPGGSHELLNLSPQVLQQVAELSLRGNCLPSDFTPEVCLSLHRLSGYLGCKAVHAFNSNKRIVAGYRGGVLNRPRFFQRLIQNVAEQSHTTSPANTPSSTPTSASVNSTFSSPASNNRHPENSRGGPSPAVWPSNDSVRTESPPTTEWNIPKSNDVSAFEAYPTNEFVTIYQRETSEDLMNYGFPTSSFLSRDENVTPWSTPAVVKQDAVTEPWFKDPLDSKPSNGFSSFLKPVSNQTIETLQAKLQEKDAEEKLLRNEIIRLEAENLGIKSENSQIKSKHEQLVQSMRHLLDA